MVICTGLSNIRKMQELDRGFSECDLNICHIASRCDLLIYFRMAKVNYYIAVFCYRNNHILNEYIYIYIIYIYMYKCRLLTYYIHLYYIISIFSIAGHK